MRKDQQDNKKTTNTNPTNTTPQQTQNQTVGFDLVASPPLSSAFTHAQKLKLQQVNSQNKSLQK